MARTTSPTSFRRCTRLCCKFLTIFFLLLWHLIMFYRDDLNLTYLQTSGAGAPTAEDIDELANLPRSEEE